MFKARSLARFFYQAIRSFLSEGGIDKATILAYYSMFSSLFLFTFFIFLFTRFFEHPDDVLKTVYPFSQEIFSVISPELLGKALDLSTKVSEVGLFGVVVFLFLGFLVVKKIAEFVNEMFHVHQEGPFWGKKFIYKRIREFGLLLIFGAMSMVSFLGTSILSTLRGLIDERQFLGRMLHPLVTEHLNSFLLLYFLPLFISFLFLFVLYKWIPERKVYLKGAVISALITSVLWEIVKRGYSYYLIHFSLFGQIRGPIIAIILFGFWMELSMAIMLFGAKLTFLFDQEKKNEIK